MIDYDEDGWKFQLFFRMYGSVAFKASWFALPSSLLAFFLVLLDRVLPEIREACPVGHDRHAPDVQNKGVGWES